MTLVGGAFELVDHNGRTVTQATFHGRFALMFFGFTHCRVVCPRALAKLSAALARLGDRADAIQPLYVTIDPQRDTPEVLRAFLNGHPRVLGLTGTADRIDAAKAAFRVFVGRRIGPGGDYQLPHSAFTHLLDRSGQHIDHWPEALDEDEIVARFSAALSGS